MTTMGGGRVMRLKSGLAALLASASITGTALAQTTGIDLRVGKLEKEMKAVQRTVFPQGVPVQPETGVSAPGTAAGNPATAPIADLTSRVDALEKSLASLTGQIEQAQFRNRQQDEAIKRIEARLTGPDTTAEPAIAPSAITPKPATSPVARPTTGAATKPPVVATKPDAARKAAIAAVEIPATGDTAEDAYSYGFRLYTAQLYPEAQTKLKEFVAKYPSHRRASYAQNLLGRAYYDEGKPALASVAFYDNYQKNPKGERAPESLYWLGQALTKLKKLPDACKVYAELTEVYGSKLSTDLTAKAKKGRADAKCTA
jgi:TolA-binding protein